jgi:hypothetical protein
MMTAVSTPNPHLAAFRACPSRLSETTLAKPLCVAGPWRTLPGLVGFLVFSTESSVMLPHHLPELSVCKRSGKTSVDCQTRELQGCRRAMLRQPGSLEFFSSSCSHIEAQQAD